MKKPLPGLLFATMVSMLFSCNKDPQPNCGCEGPTMLVIRNTRAVHEGAGLFTFQHPVTLNQISAWACDADSVWAKSENNQVPDYTISGNLKKECSFGPTNMVVFPGIEITAIQKD